MTLGEKLRKFVPKGEQKRLALEWLERMQKRGKKDLTVSTVETQFSRLLNDDVTGVRLFFQDVQSVAALFEVLAVPEAQWAEIQELADLALESDGVIPPRLVIDLSALHLDRDAADRLFAQVSDLVVKPAPLKPAVLLLSPAVYRYLPRDFDEASSWLRWEKIDLPETGADRARRLAGNRALVVSTWRFDPTERWAAMTFDGRQITTEPAGAIDAFARDGSLPLPAVECDLAALHGTADLPAVKLPSGGVEVRRMIVDLRDPKRADVVATDPLERLAYARALGVQASATERDLIEAEVREAIKLVGLPVEISDALTLTDITTRAGRRPIGPIAIRVDDNVHVINPEAPGDESFKHPRVNVHRISAGPAALTRIMEAVKQWTPHTAEADPYLTHLVAQLDPGQRDAVAMLHARATLLHSRSLKLAPAVRVEDWRGALIKVLTGEPPAAQLRIPTGDEVVPPGEDEYDDHYGERWLVAGPLLPYDLPKSITAADQSALTFVPSLARYATFGRRDSVRVVHRRTNVPDGWSQREGHLGLSFPQEAARARDIDTWLDLVDAWVLPAKRASAGTIGIRMLERARATPRFTVSFEAGDPVEANSFDWAQADRHVALTWLALRKAVPTASAVKMFDGTVLVGLGGGIVAAIAVYAMPGLLDGVAQSVRAALDLRFVENRYGSATDIGVSSMVGELDPGVKHLRYSLPHGLTILGGGFHVHIYFLGSPLHLGACGSTDAALVGSYVSDEAARREADEAAAAYDDDDE